MARAARSLVLALVLGLSQHAYADDSVVRSAVRVDGLAAVVGGLVPGEGVISIMRSDVELRARMALAGAGAADAAYVPLPAALLRATLEELLGEALIAAEAQRLSLEAPTNEELAAEQARLVQRAGGQQKLTELMRVHGVTQRELQAIVRRRATVSAFLRANLEGTLEVTPNELERAYKTEEHPFRDQPFEQVSDALRVWVAQRRLEQSVARWVESLRERTPHRVLVTY